MKKVIDFLRTTFAFLKREKYSFLCLLLSFLICSFLGKLGGLAATIILIVCNIFYIKKFNIYNVFGFLAGFGLAILVHWIY